MSGRPGEPDSGASAPEALLHTLTEEVLASAEIRDALTRSHLAPEDARAAVARGADEILAEASAEYQAYVSATARRREAAVKANMVTFAVFVFVVAYGLMNMGELTSVRIVILPILLAFVSVRVPARRTVRVRRAAERARMAGQQWREALRDNALLPFQRAWITWQATGELLRTSLDPQTAPGLIERSEPKHLVVTPSIREIVRITSTTSAGSLGLSGPRGVGKTTLIRSFCDGAYEPPDATPELRVMVSAPVDYEGRAFILHLFAQLCRAVLDSDAVKGERPALRQWIRSPLALRVPLGLALVLLGVTALWETWTGKPGPWHVTMLVGATIVSLGVVVGGLMSLGHGGGNAVQLLPSNDSGLMAERTQRQLHRLQFVQTVSTMSSATVKIGAALGADMGRTFTRQLAEQQLTLPELVQQFQSYASDVAYWWRARNGGEGRLFIGIDEVDRIVDPVGAQRFLNEVKAVFDVPHCFYLVSVSEEALVAFERRSVTLRTAFDTAFDEIVRVDYLDYKAAIELLSKRVAGLPRPFMALCHGFSGGLPRDLVRTARTLVENAREGQDRDLTSLARALVADEIHALKRSHLSSLDSTEHRRLAAVLYDKSWPEVSPWGLRQAVREDLAADPGPPAMDLTVACAFHATLLEIFEAAGFSGRLRVPDAPAAAVVDVLAEIRSVMTANHALALELINALRQAEGLPSLVPGR